MHLVCAGSSKARNDMALRGQQCTSMALGLVILWSLPILRVLVSTQAQGTDPLTDSRLSDNFTSDCPCFTSEQDINSASSNESNCALSVPDPPLNLEYHFREIATQPRHAELNLSWNQPEDDSSLCYYELRIRGISSDLNCQITDDVVFPPINKEIKNLTLTTESLLEANSTLSLLYECRYRLTVLSIPGNENVTEDILIRHSRSKLFVDCFTDYNPARQKYNVVSNWSLSDPLAMEAALYRGYGVGIREYPGFSNNRAKITNDSSYIFENLSILTETADGDPGIYAVEIEVRCLKVELDTPFFWRAFLLPHNCNENEQCNVTAPPMPPSTLDPVQVDQAAYFPSEDIVSLAVSWMLPEYSNGVLRHYQIRVGSLPTRDNQESGITFLSRTAIGPAETSLSVEFFLENKNLSEIYIQMRSVNNFSRYSNWSSPAVINLSDIIVIVTTPRPVPPQPREQFPTYAYAVIAVAVLLFLAVLMVVMYLCISKVRKHYFVDIGPEMMPMGSILGRPSIAGHSNPAARLLPIQTDEWEIPETEITVFKDQPLGEGCFGRVYKGLLMGHSLQNRPRGNFRPPIFSVTCPVAIKQLKSDALGSEKENFFKEMKMMKMVSSADNEMKKFVVNMVGCITVKEPLLLVVEFVKHGDLQTFLRTIKKQTIVRFQRQQSAAAPYLEPQGVYSELNPGSERYAELGTLEERNLLEFARQIAAGMEFLSGLGVIHRDLACRNILIGDQKNLKISDFGMSRYLPKDEVYVPMSHGLLPLRWMAIESIHAREFTTASDVWAYGIVLWELCTMCDFPYKTVANHDILGFLKQGYRLPKPNNCSTEVYDIMLRCWRDQQEERPSFPELRSLFDQFLSVYVQDHYPYMELQSSYHHYERLVPETGQLTNEMLDSSSSGGSACDVRIAGLLEDHNAMSVGIGSASTSPTKGGFLSSENGRMLHLSPLPQQNENRLSMLSDRSVQLLRLSASNQELHSNSSSMNRLDIIGRQGIQSLPTAASGIGGSFRSLNEVELVDLRYVESPVVGLSHSAMTMTSDLSLDTGLERGKGSANLKPTSSFPDCSQVGDDGGREINMDGEIRSSSFSVPPRNISNEN